MAIQDAMKKAKPVILEPVMAVEVVTPEDYMGDIIGDLTSRRGRIQHMEGRGSAQVINARVPLSEMFGYATDLRSRSQGRSEERRAGQGGAGERARGRDERTR